MRRGEIGRCSRRFLLFSLRGGRPGARPRSGVHEEDAPAGTVVSFIFIENRIHCQQIPRFSSRRAHSPQAARPKSGAIFAFSRTLRNIFPQLRLAVVIRKQMATKRAQGAKGFPFKRPLPRCSRPLSPSPRNSGLQKRNKPGGKIPRRAWPFMPGARTRGALFFFPTDEAGLHVGHGVDDKFHQTAVNYPVLFAQVVLLQQFANLPLAV